MPNVLHLEKTLIARPPAASLPGVGVRTFRGEPDINLWLDVRRQAFASEPVGVRPWSRGDFAAEFLASSWWSAERLWFAEDLSRPGPTAIGTATMAVRGSGTMAKAVVHWLCVLPEWRRRGVGRLLLATLEARCWDEGFRAVGLETHAAWTAAVRFYEAAGYGGVSEE